MLAGVIAQAYLGIEDLAHTARHFRRADHETGEDVRLLDALQLQLDVVAGVDLVDFLLIGPALHHLDGGLNWQI